MNEYTLSYTLFGGSLEKPIHLKYQFKDDADLLGALDIAACKVLDAAQEQYGAVDIILRSISHDNALEWYKLITKERTNYER